MSRLDPETLAALMEGRLSDEERARVLADLAESEADLEVLADASIAAAALAVEKEVAKASPAQVRAGIRWKVWLPLAAAVAGVALIPSLLDRTRSGGLGQLRLDLVAMGPVASPAELPVAAGGDAVRSGGSAPDVIDGLTPVARSFRRGAIFARLTVLAPAARDDSPEAAALDGLLRSTTGGVARPSVEAWLRDGADAESDWRTAAEALQEVEGAGAAFRLGLLVERLSLSGANEGGPTTPPAQWVRSLESDFADLPPDARSALESDFVRLRDRLRADPPDAGALREAVEAFATAASGLGAPPGPEP